MKMNVRIGFLIFPFFFAHFFAKFAAAGFNSIQPANAGGGM
jgi:hypothetical protein